MAKTKQTEEQLDLLTNDSNKINFSDVYKGETNKFKLAVAISKRARQIQDGAKPLVKSNGEEIAPVLIAMQELARNKFSVVNKENKDEQEEMIAEMESLIENDLLEEPEAEADKKKAKK